MVPDPLLALGHLSANPVSQLAAVSALYDQHADYRGRQHRRHTVLVLAGGLCLCAPTLPRERVPVQPAGYHHADPLAGADDPAVSDVSHHRLVWHLSAADRPVVHWQRVLYLPYPPVYAQLP